jgi:hypothetical protein
MYDNMGSGTFVVPEGPQAAGAQVVAAGEVLFNGRRPTWGNDLANIMMQDAAFSIGAGGAYLAFGRFAAGGNKTLVSGPVNTPAMLRAGGNMIIRNGAVGFRTGSVVPEAEPVWAVKGFNAYAYFVAGADLYIDGVIDPTTAAGSGTYINTGLGWGGIPAGTRYSVSSHTGLAAWTAAPTGADLAAVQAVSAVF